MLFDDYNFNVSFLEIPGSDFNKERQAILSSKEGFLRGNMFANEYEPYKNLTYFKLTPKNEKEQLMFKVMELAFAITDLNLWLDLHPDDTTAFRQFKEYVELYEKTCKEYSKKYEPLTLLEVKENNYNWLMSPWPWEKEEGKYV